MNGRQNPLAVKHYLTRIVTSGGQRAYDVFESGKPNHIIFAPVYDHINGIGGCMTTSEFWWVGRRSDLKRQISKLIPRR